MQPHVTRFGDATCDAESAQDLALAVRTMSDDVTRYRSVDAFRAMLLEWLEARAAV
jgi:hypothetical protein